MANRNLIKWAKDVLREGYSPEQIKTELLRKGYAIEEVNDLMAAINPQAKPESVPVSPAPSRSYAILWIGLIVILVIVGIGALIFTGYLNIGFGKQESAQVTPAQKIAVLGKPGVVLIDTVVSGTATMRTIVTNDLGMPVFDEYGQLVPGEDFYTRDGEEVLTGSGFIISPEGYIITNAHLVPLDEASARDMLLTSFARFMGEEWAYYYGQLPEEWISALANHIAYNTLFSNIKTIVYVNTGVAVPGLATIQKGNIADIRKAGTPVSGKDVAILKIDAKNLPTVRVGNSDVAKTGDRIYVLGYPGASELDLTATGEALEPTLTSGVISAERKTTDGFRLLQTDAAISGGNSGGPAFNEKGEVIGIATLTTIDPITGQQIQNYNYLVPINFAKGFLQELNIQNQPGSVDEHYQKGLEYLWNKKYKKAIEELEAVKRLYPGHPYVQNYITEAQEALEK